MVAETFGQGRSTCWWAKEMYKYGLLLRPRFVSFFIYHDINRHQSQLTRHQNQ